MRSFIAIELPQDIAAALEAVQKKLQSFNLKVRWVRPENIHLTLKFLGDIPTEAVEPLARVLLESAAGHAPVSLRAAGLGVFPGLRNPRVIWTGLSGQLAELRLLHGTLAENLAHIGFAKDNRAFRAHLTLGRAKGAVNPVRLSAALAAVAEFESGPFTADRIALVRSDLKPSGPVYTRLASAALTPPA